MHAGRERLLGLNVMYAGRNQQSGQAAMAVTGTPGPAGVRQQPIERWTELVDEVAAATADRVVVSSEYFATSDEATSRRVLQELGDEQVHVVLTLRPLTQLLSSSWQQHVQQGLRTDYQRWLEAMLRNPPYEEPTPSFWLHHRHDELVARWAAASSPERVTVVVVDTPQPHQLLDHFEAMLGLPTRTLELQPTGFNRSLSLPEVELIRHFNLEFKRNGLSEFLHRRVVRSGIVPRLFELRVPAAGEARISTPQWALDRAAEIGADAAESIRSTGARVLGDLSLLGAPALSTPLPDHALELPVGVTSSLIVTALHTADVRGAVPMGSGSPGSPTAPIAPKPVPVAPSRRRRVRGAVVRRVRRG